MIKIALAFLLGITILTMFQSLPHWLWALLAVPAVLVVIKYPRFLLFACLIIGFSWALVQATLKLHPGLEVSIEGVDLDVIGKVASIPSQQGRSIKFEFNIAKAYQADAKNLNKFPSKVLLSWYGESSELKLGEEWQLRVRLKQPRGFSNPGGFDYERWLFEHGIRATGYVRTKGNNMRLAHTQLSDPVFYFRNKLNTKLQKLASNNRSIIKALALGEKGELSDSRWQTLTSTGTNHLLAISGLHVGIVAGFMYLLALWLWKRSETLCLRIPAQRIAALAGMFASFMYAMLAGFSIPTQRAMIMTGSIFIAIFLLKSIRPWNTLSLALLCVLIWDPFSVLSPGFWLSFAAVALIFITLTRSQTKKPTNDSALQKSSPNVAQDLTKSLLHGLSEGLRKGLNRSLYLGRLQLVLALGLLPLTLVFFQQASIVSPIANLFAVPWVSCVVVPLVLLGSCLSLLSEALATWALQLASDSIDLLFIFLNYLHELPYARWQHAIPAWSTWPAICGVLLILLPKGMPGKIIGLILLSPLLFANSDSLSQDELHISILDVGQGLAIVLQTKEHVLLYDAGPKYSQSFNAGESVIYPFLLKRSIDVVDTLVISHTDKDHAGGVDGVLKNIPVKGLLSSAPEAFVHDYSSQCADGMTWQWNEVEFKFLHPNTQLDNLATLSTNNSSCVLLIRHPAGSFLITGDIEAPIERKLVEKYPNLIDTDVLIVPHHGSNSSSTKVFIQATSPKYAVIASGYRNPYGFPKKKVTARYHKFGSQLLNTASQGMIMFSLSKRKGMTLHQGYRLAHKRFWHSNS